MKQVFSMGTEWDKDLQTLAETTVMCKLKQKQGSCRKKDCAGCPTFGRLSACMEQLPDCDVLRVQNMAQELYSFKAFQYGCDKPSKKEVLKDIRECALTLAWMIPGLLLLTAVFVLFTLAPILLWG